MYYINPITTPPFAGVTAKMLKQVKGSAEYAGLKIQSPQRTIDILKAADPSKKKNYTKWLIDVYKRDPKTTMDDLPRGQSYLKKMWKAQEKQVPPDWAKVVITTKKFPSISSLGSYLIENGIVVIETVSDYAELAYDLQETGDAYVLYNQDGIMFIDEITEKAAVDLCPVSIGADGKKTFGWCTGGGAFGTYRDRGLIVLYNEKKNYRVQFMANFEEQKDETDTEINWNAPKYRGMKPLAEKVAKIVKERLKAMKGVYLLSEYLQNPKAKKYAVLKKYYPQNKILPVVFLEKHTTRLQNFLDGRVSEKQAKNDWNFFVKAIEADILMLELLGRKSAYLDDSTVYLDMVDIPKGSYKYQDIKVQLRAFEINAFETTNALWLYVMGEDAKGNWNDYTPVSLPKVEISWYDCIHFCNALSELQGFEPCYKVKGDEVDWIWEADGYRLPTEAEWEAAARANTDFIYAGGDDPDKVAWYADNSDGRRHPVGQKKPNKFGLYDMSGNVYEWVYDSYSSDPYDKEEMPD